MNNFKIRPIANTPEDINSCSGLLLSAFTTVANEHDFIPAFQTIEETTRICVMELSHPDIYGVVAQLDYGEHEIVGCGFLSLLDSVRGVDVVAIHPDYQGFGIGRAILTHLLEKSEKVGCESLRLVQDSYNLVSFGLYIKMGFQAKEMLSVFKKAEEEQEEEEIEDKNFELFKMTEQDAEACNEMFQQCNGSSRLNEIKWCLNTSISEDVVPHIVREKASGKLVGYTLGLCLDGHSVAENEDVMKFIILNARKISKNDPSILLMPRLFPNIAEWLLTRGYTIMRCSTLMCKGKYSDPKKFYIPTIVY